MLLASMAGQRCEAVALFPGPPASLIENKQDIAPTAIPADKSRSRLAVRPRATACISSQPGCGVGCPFCATGQLGYRGNLTAPEIVEQVYWAGCIARQHRRWLRNVVFMGMGEPLHNFASTMQAIQLLTDDEYFGLPQKRITVSTVGVPAAMLKLVNRFRNIRIALSLHSAQSELRRKLVPKAMNQLSSLREAIVAINLQQSCPVWLEVVLLAGVNDGLEDIDALLVFCQGLNVEVNLIPYNATTNSLGFAATAQSRREQIAQTLRAAGIRTTLRTSFGAEQQAACGQLTTAASESATYDFAGKK